MSKIDPALRYTASAVRSFDDGGGARVEPARINAAARAIAAQYRRDTISPAMVGGTLALVELLLLIGLATALQAWYVGYDFIAWHYPVIAVGASLVTIVLFGITDRYQVATLRNPLAGAGGILLVWAGTLALFLLAGFLLKISADYSRVWFAAWFVVGFAALMMVRLVVARFVRRWARDGTMERRAVIVGGGKAAEALIRAIEAQPFNDIRICGIFDDRADSRSPALVAGYPKLGDVTELIEFGRIARIDMLIVALPLNAESRVLSMLKKLWVLPVDIRLSAHSNQLRFRPRSYSFIGAVPMLDIYDKPIADWDSVAKRIFDILFSVLGLALFSPVLIATAIAIKLDSKGPVLFRQKRHGFNNEIIDVYKFRSMYTDQCDPTARNAVVKNDPRVTKVGRFIRRTSIDELPQFFNALKGNLSLVGPRPHAMSAQTGSRLYDEVVDGYFARHKVKPGVTGWAQVNGWRGEVDNDDKIRMRTEYDLYYIENWSLLFDLKILFMTPFSLFNAENAY